MARQKTEQEKEIRLAHLVRKLLMLTLRGNTQECKTARQRLEGLLTKHRKSWGDVDQLIALSVTHPEKTLNDGDDEDEPPPTQQDGKVPDAFKLVDWALRRFLFLEDHQYTALTLWVLHTFVFREFQHTPRLALLSPVRACGKSVALGLCAKLCLLGRRLGSASTAVLPRLIHNERITLLLDEADNLDFASDPILRAILNDGFEAAGVRALVINQETREFDLFAPLAFGAIGRLPLPLMSRSIVINMSRAPRKAMPERFDLKNQKLWEELDVVYRYVFAWAQQVRTQLDTDPPMPDGCYGRTADRWRVLFAIADALGHGDRAREAAKVFAGEHADEDVKIELLSDIRRVFGAFAEDQIAAEVLLQHLLALDDGHWAEFRGEHGNQAPKPLRRPAMVTMISTFGIRTRTLWPRHRMADTKSSRGYTRADFERAWDAYCGDDATATHPSVIRHLRRP
jgi:Protein of unknown function (DUF3631)